MLSKGKILTQAFNQSQQFPTPVIQFFDWVSKKQIQQLQENHKLTKLIYKTVWDLDYGQYNSIADTELFSLMSQVRIERLNLTKNKKPNILREIKQASFPLLTKLLLNDNLINSLEFMNHLDCPNLQAIALMNNKITHIRSLKKTKFPQLNFIALEKNFIQNFLQVTLMRSDNLTQLVIQIQSNDKVMGYDISWISKIKSKDLKELKFLSKNRILMPKTKKMLTQKFEQLQMDDKNIIEFN